MLHRLRLLDYIPPQASAHAPPHGLWLDKEVVKVELLHVQPQAMRNAQHRADRLGAVDRMARDVGAPGVQR
jgi:hypothetical protein